MTATAIALAAVVGLAMGVFGGGGSLLLVPALTHLVGLDAKQAVVTSLAVVGWSAGAGAIAGYFQDALRIRPAVITGATTMIGAFSGALVGARLDDRVQMTIFGVATIGAAVIVGWQATRPSHRVVQNMPQRLGLIATAGIAVGFLTGVIGVGGGFLIVPALVAGAGLDLRQAVPVSLFVMVLATGSALAGYAGRVTLNWGFVVPFGIVASIGTLAGGAAGRAMPQRLLQYSFAVVLIVVAAFALIRS